VLRFDALLAAAKARQLAALFELFDGGCQGSVSLARLLPRAPEPVNRSWSHPKWFSSPALDSNGLAHAAPHKAIF